MKRLRILATAAAAGLTVSLGAGAQAVLPLGWQVTIEAPGDQTGPSQQYFDSYGVETFNGRVTNPSLDQQLYSPLQTDFGSGNIIQGEYHDVYAHRADQYGGSAYDGGNGGSDYAVAGLGNGQSSYSLTLTDTTSQNGNVNYFGFWLSALDANNNLTFRDNGVDVGTFTAADVLALVIGDPAYFGNPVSAFFGQNDDEPYVFINFLDLNGPGFDEIIFSEINGSNAGYESDNHTVGWFDTVTNPGGLCDVNVNPECTVVNPPPSAVPEPASWAMMIAGFGLVGVGLRRRQTVAAAFA